MFFDWWMIGIFLIVSGLWSEWRFFNGRKQTIALNMQIINNHVRKAVFEAYSVGVTDGAQKTIDFLKENKILSLDINLEK